MIYSNERIFEYITKHLTPQSILINLEQSNPKNDSLEESCPSDSQNPFVIPQLIINSSNWDNPSREIPIYSISGQLPNQPFSESMPDISI